MHREARRSWGFVESWPEVVADDHNLVARPVSNAVVGLGRLDVQVLDPNHLHSAVVVGAVVGLGSRAVDIDSVVVDCIVPVAHHIRVETLNGISIRNRGPM